MSKKLPPFTSWDQVPLSPGIEDVARIRDLSVTTIYREVDAGRFRPAPLPRVGKTTPLKWSKDELMEWHAGERPEEKPRRARCFSGSRRLSIAS